MRVYQLDFEKGLNMTTVNCIWIATDGDISIPKGSELVNLKEIVICAKDYGIDVVVKKSNVLNLELIESWRSQIEKGGD